MNARSLLLSTAVLTLPVLLAGCCICPKTGRIKPCARSSGEAVVAAPAAAPTQVAPEPQVRGGTRAPDVPGAPDMWVAAKGVHVAGQPEEAAWAGYSAAGYRTIVNFRPPSEGADRERELVVANGMQYFNLPITGPNLEWGAADALAKIVADPANGTVLLHCSSGNRAAGIWALYRARHDGLTRDAAIAEAESLAPLKPVVRNRLLRMLPEHGAE